MDIPRQLIAHPLGRKQFWEEMVTADIPSRGFLIGAAIGHFMVAILHFTIPFLGSWAYAFFGSPYLASLADAGSAMPAIAAYGVGIVFARFGFMGISAAGVTRYRQFYRSILWGVGAVYVFRGLLFIPQVLLLFQGRSTIARGPVFSLIALIVGMLQLLGLWKSRRSRSSARSPAA